MEVVQSIAALLDAGFRELRLQKVEKRTSMIDRGLEVPPQPPAQTCRSAPMTLFKRIGASQVGNWPYSFQSAMEVQWQLLTLWDIRSDRLCGLVVRVSGYRYRGLGFDSPRYQIF